MRSGVGWNERGASHAAQKPHPHRANPVTLPHRPRRNPVGRAQTRPPFQSVPEGRPLATGFRMLRHSLPLLLALVACGRPPPEPTVPSPDASTDSDAGIAADAGGDAGIADAGPTPDAGSWVNA